MILSVWKMIASNYPLPEVKPEKEYPLEINLDEGTIFDGDADDNFLLYPLLDDVGEYTDMEYGTTLEWAYYTEGRAIKIIEIIKSVLQHTDCVELWNFWLGDLEEHEHPIIKVATIPLAELTSKDIQEWDIHKVWNVPSRYGDRPMFYCLKIVR
jgi:hypothetical protein